MVTILKGLEAIHPEKILNTYSYNEGKAQLIPFRDEALVVAAF